MLLLIVPGVALLKRGVLGVDETDGGYVETEADGVSTPPVTAAAAAMVVVIAAGAETGTANDVREVLGVAIPWDDDIVAKGTDATDAGIRICFFGVGVVWLL